MNSLIRNSFPSKKLEAYDKVIQDQITARIVEKVLETEAIEKNQKSGRELYLPHRPVIRLFVERTKLRIIFDASAKTSNNTVSLNDCYETCPPLQNVLREILIILCVKPIALCGDIEKAFL